MSEMNGLLGDLLIRFHHVAFFVGNLEEAVQFYEELFGFQLCFTGYVAVANERVAILKWKTMILELLQVPELDSEELRRRNSGVQTHISFMVKDVEGAKSRLLARSDVRFEEETVRVVPDIGPMDLMVTFFRGPNGERIELLQDKNSCEL